MRRILFLDDNSIRCAWAATHLNAVTRETASACIAQLETSDWDELYLDHDLGGSENAESDSNSGMAVVRWLEQNTIKKPSVVIHSLNYAAAERMEGRLAEAGYSVVRVPYLKLKEQTP